MTTVDTAVDVRRWRATDVAERAALSALLLAYHRQTEAEKGAPIAEVGDLPAAYRAEVDAPEVAFARSTVLVAMGRGTGHPEADVVLGCCVLTPVPHDLAATPAGASDTPTEAGTDTSADTWAELKRLWVAPEARGRGVATALLRAAIAEADAAGVGVRLSVWDWRATAITVYARLGFEEVDSWDPRPGLVCLQRPRRNRT